LGVLDGHDVEVDAVGHGPALVAQVGPTQRRALALTGEDGPAVEVIDRETEPGDVPATDAERQAVGRLSEGDGNALAAQPAGADGRLGDPVVEHVEEEGVGDGARDPLVDGVEELGVVDDVVAVGVELGYAARRRVTSATSTATCTTTSLAWARSSMSKVT